MKRVAALALPMVALAACLPAPTPWSSSPAPFGAFDIATVTTSGEVSVSGWADESDTDSPVTVVFFANGKNVGTATANQPRADVAANYPKSTNAGYNATFTDTSLTPGTAVCASAINRGAGGHTVLGCATIAAVPTTAASATTAAPATTTSTTTTAPTTSTTVPPAESGNWQVEAGGRHVLALASDGTVWAWGYNLTGQLGNDSTEDSPSPIAVELPAGPKVIAVSAGDDSAEDRYNAELVSLPTGSPYIAVSAGDDFIVALRQDGTVVTWGDNDNGQSGRGDETDRALPGVIAGFDLAAQ